MTEYTVHFQKGSRVGARSLRMLQVTADSVVHAIEIAKAEFNVPDYHMSRVDHFENGSIVIDLLSGPLHPRPTRRTRQT